MSKETLVLPPTWCSAICRNALNEVCVEKCALKRDCSAFRPKSGLPLEDIPPFPLSETAGMTKEEKFVLVAFYLSKVVDYLQGNENVQSLTVPQKPHVVPADERKVVTDVASFLQGSESATGGVEQNKTAHQNMETPEFSSGSDVITSKEIK